MNVMMVIVATVITYIWPMYMMPVKEFATIDFIGVIQNHLLLSIIILACSLIPDLILDSCLPNKGLATYCITITIIIR